MWSCPNCGAVQAAASRCWVCRRSSTTCSTCRHFRTSLTAEIGWCALDRKRRPLTGLELRGCWAERPASVAAETAARPPHPAPTTTWRDEPIRGFVPVETVARSAPPPPPAAPASAVELSLDVPLVVVEPVDAWDGRVSLFGDLER